MRNGRVQFLTYVFLALFVVAVGYMAYSHLSPPESEPAPFPIVPSEVSVDILKDPQYLGLQSFAQLPVQVNPEHLGREGQNNPFSNFHSLSTSLVVDAGRIDTLTQMQALLGQYHEERKSYPPGNFALGTLGATKLCSASGFSDFCNGVIYLDPVPKDPIPNSEFRYDSCAFEAQPCTSYSITFTTHNDVGELKAGKHVMTSAGIE